MTTDPPDDTVRTARLVDALVEDAAPVEPIHPTGRVMAGMSALYVIWWVGCVWALGGIRDLAAWLDVIADGFFVGLLSSLAGATGVALAAREPGRDRMGRSALALAAVGGAAMCATFLVRVGAPGDVLRLGVEANCTLHAALLGAVPAAMMGMIARGGWRGRPLAASLAAAASGVALGAIVVQATCPATGAWHVMFGHYVFPLIAAAFAGGAAALVWRAVARR